MEAFSGFAERGLLSLPKIPAYVTSNYHIFFVLMESETRRNQALSFFREKGIGTTFHYLPLHLSPVGLRIGYSEGDFPVTESVSGRLLRLPMYPSLTEDAVAHVVSTMKDFLAQ